MTLVLRDATASDVPTLLRFVRALADYERLAEHVVATESDLHSHLFGAVPRAEAVLAERDDEPLGFAIWYHGFTTFAGRPTLYVEDVFVVPEARGTGIGRAIFAHLARLALLRDCSRMEWSVLDWNAPSIAFYAGLGAGSREGWLLNTLSGEALARLAAAAV